MGNLQQQSSSKWVKVTRTSGIVADTCSGNEQDTQRKNIALAYLTTEYPKVSHSFIRREITELERTGQSVLRLAIRVSDTKLADRADIEEFERTHHCLSEGAIKLTASAIITFLKRPLAFCNAAITAWKMARRSDRGLLRHFAYLIEASHLLRILHRESIDHLHVHFGTNATTVARLINHLGGPTYSFTVHGPDEFDAPVALSLSEKVQDALFVVAISEFGKSQISRWTDYRYWSKIHVVHCTIDDKFLTHSKPVNNNSRTFVCVGRLSAQKGQFVLLDAFAQLIKDGQNAKLVLAGDGELRPAIEKRIIELNLKDHVRITGWIDESQVRHELLAARALVLPSFAEGLPVVIMEAFALGRPVITTAIAGIPELVKAGENGWLVTAGNVHELVKAMQAALTMASDELNQMGLAGQHRVKQQHLAVTEVNKLRSLFYRYLQSN